MSPDFIVSTGLASNPANAFVRADTTVSTSSLVASGLFNTAFALNTSFVTAAHVLAV